MRERAEGLVVGRLCTMAGEGKNADGLRCWVE